MSTGQKRRVALARALVRPVPLPLLNEPAAALDPEAEERVVVGLTHLPHGRTIVLANHRPGLLRLADQVVQLR